MRASLLTFLLLLLLLNPEKTLNDSGGDGMCKLEELPKIENSQKVDHYESRIRMNCITNYVRKAGTSNRFQCENKIWINKPPLQCIRDPNAPPTTIKPTGRQTLTPVTNATTGRTYIDEQTTHVTWEQTKSTSTMSTPPTWTPDHTQRTTPKKKATTTSLITTTYSSKTVHTFSVSTRSSQSSSISTTIIAENGTNSQLSSSTKQGIAAGLILVIILSAGAVAAFIIRRQRSSQHREAENAPHTSEMNLHYSTVQPLMENSRTDHFDA